MIIAAHRSCEKQIKKLSTAIRSKLWKRMELLNKDPQNSLLNDHKLKPPYDGYRSVNITGDYRLVYKKLDANTYYLRAIGTHHELYGS